MTSAMERSVSSASSHVRLHEGPDTTQYEDAPESPIDTSRWSSASWLTVTGDDATAHVDAMYIRRQWTNVTFALVYILTWLVAIAWGVIICLSWDLRLLEAAADNNPCADAIKSSMELRWLQVFYDSWMIPLAVSVASQLALGVVWWLLLRLFPEVIFACTGVVPGSAALALAIYIGMSTTWHGPHWYSVVLLAVAIALFVGGIVLGYKGRTGAKLFRVGCEMLRDNYSLVPTCMSIALLYTVATAALAFDFFFGALVQNCQDGDLSAPVPLNIVGGDYPVKIALAVLFLWMSFLTLNVKRYVVVASFGWWFFHGGDPTTTAGISSAVARTVKWSFTCSLGTLALAAAYPSATLGALVHIFDCCWSCVATMRFRKLNLYLRALISLFSRLLGQVNRWVIAYAALTGKAFFGAAHQSHQLLRRAPQTNSADGWARLTLNSFALVVSLLCTGGLHLYVQMSVLNKDMKDSWWHIESDHLCAAGFAFLLYYFVLSTITGLAVDVVDAVVLSWVIEKDQPTSHHSDMRSLIESIMTDSLQRSRTLTEMLVEHSGSADRVPYSVNSPAAAGSNTADRYKTPMLPVDVFGEWNPHDAVEAFNAKPKKAVAMLREDRWQSTTETEHELAHALAEFVMFAPNIDPVQVGEFLSDGDELNSEVLRQYCLLLDFENQEFDDALRDFLTYFRLPGEAQRIDRMMEAFARRFCHTNARVFASPDTAYVLAFSLIMLNTDAHNPAIKKKMTKDEFLRNNRGINEGKDMPRLFMENLYNRIKVNEIKMSMADSSKPKPALDPDDVELAGFLIKVADTETWFNERWFVLSNHNLYYFEKKKDERPKGIVPLENLKVKLVEPATNTFELYAPFVMHVKSLKIHRSRGVVEGRHKSFLLSAPSPHEAANWMAAIERQMVQTPFVMLLESRRARIFGSTGADR